jgi:hypothetical protein
MQVELALAVAQQDHERGLQAVETAGKGEKWADYRRFHGV